MTRLRRWCAPIFALALTPAIHADDKKSDSPWAIDRSLTVSPSGVQAEAFKYRLLPMSSELKEGNAAPIYLRLAHEQPDAAKKYYTETPKPWITGPIDKMPRKEAHDYLNRMGYMLNQFELGARRKSCDWSYTLDVADPISLLLPDAQAMRGYYPMLVLQVRAALADGDFKAAAHHLETGFAFSRHIGEAPFLISSLVAIAQATQFVGAVGDFIEQPGSPNLYWPLAALPKPLIDQRRGHEFEYRILEMTFPDLDDVDRDRSPEQWDRLLREIRKKIRYYASIPEEGKPSGQLAWAASFSPDEPAAKSPHLAEARERVARSRKLSAEQVAAMPPAKVLVLRFIDVYHEDRDSIYRATCLPYSEGFKLYAEAHGAMNAPPTTEGRAMSKLLMSAVNRAISSQARLERNLAALRVVEALRIYAASHDGKLPEKLSNVTEVFVPDDPGTGKPFDYARDGEAAIVSSRIPEDPSPNNGVRYRVAVRK